MSELVTENTLAEYENFIKGHLKGHFMQSNMWAKQKPAWKWRALVSRDGAGNIRGSLAVLIRRVPGTPFTLMYGCRGPVCDIHDRETLADLCKGAISLARANRSYVLKLDPDVVSGDRTFDELMKGMGFKQAKENKNFESIQPRYVFRLPTEGRTEEDILAAIHSKTRYNIRLAQRKGIEIRICGKESLGAFSALMTDTGVRDGFVTRPQSYFEAMLDNLGEHARLYMAFYNEVPVAGAVAVWFGDKVWYLYGASSNEHRSLMPNYLMQWEMIRWALENKCRIYDFRGVSGDLSEDNPLYGLYKFKKGFGGEFTEFIGELDYIVNPMVHMLVERGAKAFKKLRKSMYLFRNRGRESEKREENGGDGSI